MSTQVVQKRLVADPSLGLMDIQKVILSHFHVCKDFDLFSALDCPGHQKWSWKTAPNVAWMAKTAELVCSVLKIAPNGVLASQKVKGALLKLTQTSNKFNRTRYCDTDWADHCDLRLRTVLSQYRELKKRSDTYACAMRKASTEEKDAIDMALAKLRLDYGESSGTQEGSEEQLQLVPYIRPPAATTMEPKDSQSVFARILARRSSSPEQIAPAPGQNLQRQNASFFCAPDQQIAPAEGQNQQRKPGFFCVPPSETSETEPPTPVVNARTKRNTILDQKPLAQCGLGEEDEAILQQALGTSVPVQATRQKRNKVPFKKPGAKVGKQKATKQTKEGSGPASSSNANAEAEKKTNKCTFKHRKTSAAYHAAKKRALQDGHSPSTAKSLGRAASSKVASSIDAGILKE